MPFFDPFYMLFWIPGLLFSLVAQARVKYAFAKYSKVEAARGLSGAQAARRILQAAGLGNLEVEETGGFLGDHYDPSSKTLRLSQEVYGSSSLAAVGVAAHEAGHALQDAGGYAPIRLRSALVPAATLGSSLAWIVLAVGFMLHSLGMMKFGVLLFSAVVLFQIVTLPVELDASRRALLALENAGIVQGEEIGGVRAVLSAAALTYLAAAVASLLQLAYFLLRSGLLGGGRDD